MMTTNKLASFIHTTSGTGWGERGDLAYPR